MVGAIYDWWMARIDRKGAASHRERVAGEASGDVLEIGVGTGRNLPLYRNARRVVALEPHAGMRHRAARRAGEAPVPVVVVDGDAMHLPFPDGSFDAVVASLVLCSVAEQRHVLEEVRRVLRPGGLLRFYEHVRSPDPRLARWPGPHRRPVVVPGQRLPSQPRHGRSDRDGRVPPARPRRVRLRRRSRDRPPARRRVAEKAA